MITHNFNGFVIRENMSELAEDLKKAPERMKPVIKKHALNIQANAAADAPVDTGALKNSISSGESDMNSQLWEVFDQVKYGVHQELGTSRGIPAKHFLGGAAEREAEEFFDDVRDAI